MAVGAGWRRRLGHFRAPENTGARSAPP